MVYPVIGEKTTNCWLFKWDCLACAVETWCGVWFTQKHRNPHILRSHKHTLFHTPTKNNLPTCSQTTVIKLICWLIQSQQPSLTQTVRQPKARTVLRPCSPSSPVMGGSPLGPERVCVDALMFMFGRLAMMKECLFKSGLERPLFNAPPYSPYEHTHTHTHTKNLRLPQTYTHSYQHVYILSHV